MAEKTAKKSGAAVFARMGKFFKGLLSEMKKIVWPTGKQVVNNTAITIFMCLLVGAFIWLLDLGLVNLLDLVLKYK